MSNGDAKFKIDFDSFAKQRSQGSGEEYVDFDESWKPTIDTPKYGIHYENPSRKSVRNMLNA